MNGPRRITDDSSLFIRCVTSNEQNYPLHILDSHESLPHAIIRSNETDAHLTVKLSI